MSEGRFIVLEGGEGVGKSTQARLLSTWMEAVGIPHILAREPGGTPVGEAIRSVVLERTDLEMPAETELFLILAARAAFVADVVRPALARGVHVLADRFALSTLAYQGHGRGLDLDEVRGALDLATRGLTPDLYVLLDLPADEGSARQRAGGMTRDRIEAEGGDFLVRVRQAYLDLAETAPHIVILDAGGTVMQVHERIRKVLSTRFPETFGTEGV